MEDAFDLLVDEVKYDFYEGLSLRRYAGSGRARNPPKKAEPDHSQYDGYENRIQVKCPKGRVTKGFGEVG